MKMFPYRFIISLLAFVAVAAASAFPSESATLYLQDNGRLSPTPPISGTKYYLSEQSQLEWTYSIKGSLVGAQYGYSIYGQTNVQGGVSAAVEILLRRGGSEEVLAQWPRGLWNTRGVQRFSGSHSGQQPDTSEGDVLVVRISMNTLSSFHQYGTVWASKQYPSSITVPDFGVLTGVDMQKVRDELSSGQSQLDQVLQQQAETQQQLQQLTSTVQRLEFMMQDLRTIVENKNREAEQEAQSQPAAPTLVHARLRFVPSTLELPTEPDSAFNCFLALETPRTIAEVDLDSLRLNGTEGSLKPDPNLCSLENQDAGQAAELRICFPVREVGKLFSKETGRTLFSTLELTGTLKDGVRLRGRGVIQITRAAK